MSQKESKKQNKQTNKKARIGPNFRVRLGSYAIATIFLFYFLFVCLFVFFVIVAYKFVLRIATELYHQNTKDHKMDLCLD